MDAFAIIVHPSRAAARAPGLETNLPLELVRHTLEFLKAPELARVASVCRSWLVLASCDRIWDAHVQVDWGISPVAFRPPKPVAKKLYESMHCNLRSLGQGRVQP